MPTFGLMKASWKKYTLQFKQPSGTSRGVLRTKNSYFLILEQNGKTGIGECGMLRGLSADDRPDYEAQLNYLVNHLHQPFAKLMGDLQEFPSLQFGLEMAFRDLETRDHVLFETPFTQGETTQPINGLIWMGSVDFMKEQVRKRLEEGFTVLKMKVGAVDFEDELRILQSVRQEYSADELELRVDANGAFGAAEALHKLERLAALQIHSIEQPIKKGQWHEMASLCEATPLPIALDEELIGVFEEKNRRKLISTIRPQYIILKPSFIGGFQESEEWIALAEEFGAGWWVTSALESNIGLNAIAQWNATLDNPMPSGLGTGSLYTNNFKSPLYVEGGRIGYNPMAGWEINFG